LNYTPQQTLLQYLFIVLAIFLLTAVSLKIKIHPSAAHPALQLLEKKMKTTLNEIRRHSPCSEGWEKLLRSLNKKKADDEPLSIVKILDSNGLDDALWCLRAVSGHDREIRLFAVWCARQVEHLMEDQRSKDALNVAERFANGEATQDELAAAGAAAGDAAWDAARAAAWAAARAAAWAAARAAARAAAGAAAGDAAWAAARDAAGDAAWAAARAAQEKRLRELCAQIEAKELDLDDE